MPVKVQGQEYPLREAMAEPELVEKMTESERQEYVRLCQELMSHHYH